MQLNTCKRSEKIAIIGTGAIGLAIAYLLNDDHCPLIGISSTRNYLLQSTGITLIDKGKKSTLSLHVKKTLDSDVDIVILTTKIDDSLESLTQNYPFVRNAVIITCQNGIGIEKKLYTLFPPSQVVSTLVLFGATMNSPSEVVYNFPGSWIMQLPKAFEAHKKEMLIATLKNAGNLLLTEDIEPIRHLKLFLNMNNCFPAILGKSMQEVFSDHQISKIAMALWRECYRVLTLSGKNIADIPDFPKERFLKLLAISLDTAAEIFTSIMTNLSKEPIYGSFYQSIAKGKKTEVDYINGFFCSLALPLSLSTPINDKIIALVHSCEKTGVFLSSQELWQQIVPFISMNQEEDFNG